jgi:hypothetical protein
MNKNTRSPPSEVEIFKPGTETLTADAAFVCNLLAIDPKNLVEK